MMDGNNPRQIEIRNSSVLEESSLDEPFLTLITEGVNNHYIMFCPEFEISAAGYGFDNVKRD
ncbi:MAG: hypothetical protein AB1571_01515 [Nanoarchaeota archaeon]